MVLKVKKMIGCILLCVPICVLSCGNDDTNSINNNLMKNTEENRLAIDPFDGLRLISTGYDGYGSVKVDISGCHNVCQQIDYNIYPESGIANGDTITIEISYFDDVCVYNNCFFEKNKMEYTIDDLIPIEFVDPFKGLVVQSMGISPYAKIVINDSECEEWVQKYVHTEVNKEYVANGDVVVINRYLENENVIGETGKSLQITEKSYLIDGMAEYANTFDGIDFSEIQSETVSIIKAGTAITDRDDNIFNIFIKEFMSDESYSKIRGYTKYYREYREHLKYELSDYRAMSKPIKEYLLVRKNNQPLSESAINGKASQMDDMFNLYVRLYEINVQIDATAVSQSGTGVSVDVSEEGKVYVAVTIPNIIVNDSDSIVGYGSNYGSGYFLESSVRLTELENNAIYRISDIFNIHELD